MKLLPKWLKRLLCSHTYQLLVWGDRVELPEHVVYGSYIKGICTTCGVCSKVKFTHGMNSRSVKAWCEANNWTLPTKEDR